MEQRVSLITLGVADVVRARAFYEAMGWKVSQESKEDVAFFQAGSMVLALWGRKALADDAGVANSKPDFSGVALAWIGRSETEVDAVLAKAAPSGGKLVKAGQKTFWGGYAGYFADPDGHLWEVAHNPYWRLDDAGGVHLPR